MSNYPRLGRVAAVAGAVFECLRRSATIAVPAGVDCSEAAAAEERTLELGYPDAGSLVRPLPDSLERAEVEKPECSWVPYRLTGTWPRRVDCHLSSDTLLDYRAGGNLEAANNLAADIFAAGNPAAVAAAVIAVAVAGHIHLESDYLADNFERDYLGADTIAIAADTLAEEADYLAADDGILAEADDHLAGNLAEDILAEADDYLADSVVVAAAAATLDYRAGIRADILVADTRHRDYLAHTDYPAASDTLEPYQPYLADNFEDGYLVDNFELYYPTRSLVPPAPPRN